MTTYKSLLISLTFSTLVFSSVAQVNRQWTKSYPVSGNDFTLSVAHEYGDIIIEEQQGTSIDVVVDIEIEARNAKKSQAIADGVTIVDKTTSNKVELKTVYKEKLQNVEMDVTYTIKAPSSVILDLKNGFGNLALADWSAPATIYLSYGTMKAGNLEHASNDYHFSFSTAVAGNMNGKQIKLSYSTLKGDVINVQNIDSDFSTLTADMLNKVEISSEYDKLSIDDLGAMKGKVAFSDLDIDNLKETLILKAQYSQIDVDHVEASAKEVDVSSQMGNVSISVDDEMTGTFELDASQGGIDIPKQFNVSTSKDEMFSTHRSGTIGASDKGCTVKISTSFAEIDIDN